MLQVTSQDDLTVMLLSVVFVYMICQPWEPLRRILEHLFGYPVPCFSPYFYFTEISSLSTALNSGVNFFLFCAFGSKFRRVLKNVFFCINEIDKRNGASNTSVTSAGSDSIEP